ICTLAAGNGIGLYIVGGFVRDLMLGGAVREVDLVVEGDAIGFTQTVASRLGGRVTPHRRFGTAKWRLPRELATACGWTVLDFVMARSESYARPAALPVVTRAAIRDDMLRRDFTINTLAICLDAEHAGDVLDSCGGAADLELRLLKVLHPRSFEDDPTRMLRAVRFAERLGCELAPGTLRLFEPACAHVAALSGDRVRHELQLVFEEKHPAKVLARLDGFGLLAAIYPSLANTADAWLVEKLSAAEAAGGLAEVRWLVWLYRLSGEAAQAVAQRLRLPVRLRAALQQAQQLGAQRNPGRRLAASEIVALLAGVQDWALAALVIAVDDEELRSNIQRYRADLRHVKPLVTGHVLRARGLAAGPQYSKVLARLRDAWLDGKIHDAAGELALLDQLLLQP
ncbi:MAG: polynucleotide adenylyltransferase, partial [Chloroflexi bacterium]|nr:polynucleotide adenylyltransferase [Chloroflexota bacterium]